MHSSMTPAQKRALNYATAGAIVVGLVFLRNYLMLTATACIIAYLFHPLYVRLKKHMSTNSAATITMLCSLLLVVIPLILVTVLAAKQLASIGTGVSESIRSTDLSKLGQDTLDSVNELLARIPFINAHVSEASIADSAKSIAQTVGNTLLGYLTGFVSSFISLFTTVIVFIFIQFSLIKHGNQVLAIIRELNPLGREATDHYLEKMGAMVRGTVQGQFIIALVQGFLASATIALVGYPQLFFVLFIITTVLSVIPLGAGILVMPIGIVMALFGNVWGGVIVNLEHLIINTNVDNVLRPRLVPKAARLDAALMLVSVFAGIATFGYLGIVIGPTLMIVLVTTLDVYLRVQKGYKSAAPDHGNPHSLRMRLAGLNRDPRKAATKR